MFNNISRLMLWSPQFVCKGVPGLRGSVDKCSPTIVIESSPRLTRLNIHKIFILYLGDRGGTQGDNMPERYLGPLPTRHLKVRRMILYSSLCCTGNQWGSRRVIYDPAWGVDVMTRAALFWHIWSGLRYTVLHPDREVESYNNLLT